MKKLHLAATMALSVLLSHAAYGQQTVIDWAPSQHLDGNTQQLNLTATGTVESGAERVSNYNFDVTPMIAGGVGNYSQNSPPDLFGILQVSSPISEAAAPEMDINFMRKDVSELRLGANTDQTRSANGLVWVDQSSFANPLSSMSDVINASLTSILRGSGATAGEARFAVRDSGQWYLSNSSVQQSGGFFSTDTLAITDMSAEMWGAYSPATSTSDAFVSSAGSVYNTASSSLNNIEALGYYLQVEGDTSTANTRLYSRGFSFLVDAPATEFVSDISLGSDGLLGEGGVSINGITSPAPVLTRNSGTDANAANLSSSDTWSYTLSNIALDNDGAPNDTISFDVSLASTFANGVGEEFEGEADRYLHDRINLLGDSNADYNNDQTVDAADYTVWRDNLGATGEPGAVPGDGTGVDGEPDGTVDQLDYDLWNADYGQIETQEAGGGFGVEPADVGVGEGGMDGGETLQFTASNLTYSRDGGSAETDGTIDGFIDLHFANVLNRDLVGVNGEEFEFIGQGGDISLGETASADITVAHTENTLSIGDMNIHGTKTQSYNVADLTLRVTIPVAAAGLAVPEPTAVGLAAVGLLACLVRRRAGA
ncbi:hypothetical protein MalM25_17310 [Planctomycetes bacterium MalM25]|nr:hypothetical protein MalM25_17310 [Planctomycetes bacterium MalM25]